MNAIQTYRSRAGISRQEMAKLLGCSVAMVQHVESGARRPSAETAVEWEKRIGIPREEIRPDIFKRDRAA